MMTFHGSVPKLHTQFVERGYNEPEQRTETAVRFVERRFLLCGIQTQ